MQATKLQTNHLTAPIGMGTGPLFLSWQWTDGMRQTTYEIEVTANNKTVWQSGKVQSSAMHADTPAVADSRVRGAWKIPIRYRTTTGVMIQWARASQAVYRFDERRIGLWTCP